MPAVLTPFNSDCDSCNDDVAMLPYVTSAVRSVPCTSRDDEAELEVVICNSDVTSNSDAFNHVAMLLDVTTKSKALRDKRERAVERTSTNASAEIRNTPTPLLPPPALLASATSWKLPADNLIASLTASKYTGCAMLIPASADHVSDAFASLLPPTLTY